jgi:hypothetical protein
LVNGYPIWGIAVVVAQILVGTSLRGRGYLVRPGGQQQDRFRGGRRAGRGLLILSQSGWMLAVAVRTSGLLSTGVTPAFATLVRALPSGWGLYAVAAAGRSDWLTAVGMLAGLAAAIALLLLAWSWKLGSPRAARATIRGTRRVRALRTWWISLPTQRD